MISGIAPYYSSYRKRRTVFLTIPAPLSDRIQMPDNSLYVNTESGIRKSGGGEFFFRKYPVRSFAP